MKQRLLLVTLSLLFVSTLLYAGDSDKYIQDAKNYLDKGEKKAAIIQLKNALQENPANIEARLMLGNIYLKAGDGASAEKEFIRAKKLNAARSYWQLDLAKAYLMQRKFKEVLDTAQDNPSASNKDRAAIWLVRGDAQLGLRKYKLAREAYSQAKTITPDTADPMLGLVMTDVAEGKRKEALEGVQALLSRFPESVPGLVLRAEMNLQSGKKKQALEDLNKAIALQPNHLRALLERANINLSSGRIEQAKSDLAKAEKLAPGHPQLLYLSGAVALLEHKLDKAETLLQEAYNANPRNLQVTTMLGAVNFYKGNYESAHELLSQVLKARPALLPAIKLFASVQLKLKQTGEVIKLLEPALKRFPNDPQLMAMLGTAYMKSKRYEEGSALMNRAIEISPNLASYRTQLAMGLLAQGKTGEAIKELQSTIDMDKGKEFIQADILLVLSHLKKKEYDKALEASQALEKKSPDNPVGYNLSGLAYLMNGKRQQAEQRFKKALDVDPNFVTAEANLARMAMQQGDDDKAKSYLESALKKAPQNATILIGLANLAKKSGDLATMHDLLERASNGKPKSSRPGLLSAQSYLREGQPLKALRVTSQLAADYPNETAVLLAHGKTQLAAGDPINAVNTFTRLTGKVKNAETLHLLGSAQQAAKQIDAARTTYQQALKLKPDFVPVLIGLYSLELQTRNTEKALSYAKSIQKAQPKSPVGYEFEGTVYALSHQPQKAIPLYQKSYQMVPSEKRAILLAGQFEASGQVSDGIKLLQKWIAEHPSHLQAQLKLGAVFLSQGRHDESIAEYEKLLKTDAKNIVALNNLAWLYSTKGDKRAMEISKRAYDLAPGQPAIIDTYGWILVQNGDFSKGTEILKQAAEMAPNNQEIVYHLGYSLNKQGNHREAESTLKRAIGINSQSALAETSRQLLNQIQKN